MDEKFKIKCEKDIISKDSNDKRTKKFTSGKTYDVVVEGVEWVTHDDNGKRHVIFIKGANEEWYKEYFTHV